jgi:hypothetical protein
MASEFQTKQLEKRLREYRKKYLTRKQNLELDESATRLMVNYFLTEVLGYAELEDIKTEYNIRGEWADYVVQLKRKKHFIIEVKSIQLDLSTKHLRQSTAYAANEGIDWIVLLNGKQIQLYRLIFAKPISTQLVFDFDLAELSSIDDASKHIVYLTKQSVAKNELEPYWKHFDALSSTSMIKHIYTMDVINAIRRKLRQSTGANFDREDIVESLHKLISEGHEVTKPRTFK